MRWVTPSPLKGALRLWRGKDCELNNLENCLESMRFTLPHPLTPSPRAGEGEQDSFLPLPFWERGWG
jgi:hypothetical protein